MHSAHVLTALLLAGTAAAQFQIPIPSFTGTFASAIATRGFYFQAPFPITIVGLRVPDEANAGVQCVEVSLLTGAPPPFPGTASGGQVFFANNVPSNQIIPCSLSFNTGDYIGVLGACGTTTMNNSYSVPGPFTSNILGTPITLDRFLTQFNLSTTGGNQPYSSEPGGTISRVEVYLSAAGYATSFPYGTGCYDQALSFYENFGANTFDLAGTASTTNSISMLPSGGGYIVLPGSNNWWTPVSANLALGDDQVSGAEPLGFTFPYPGGSTSSIYVSSNGFVYLQPDTNPGCCVGDPVALLSGTTRLAPFWMDLYPPGGGSIVFDVDAVNQVAYVTYTSIAEFGAAANLNTFQVALFATGQVEYRYQACANTVHQQVTGWSLGGGARDPGSVDISASMPIVTAPDATAIDLSSGRPVLGTTFNFTTGNIPAGTVAGAQILSFTQHNPGLDLSFLGMPGCSQYVGLDVALTFLASGSSATLPLTLPNNVGLAGLHFYSQSATFTAGVNPLGVLASNGLDLTVDVQ